MLNVYNWENYIDEKIIEDFTEEFGIKVNYEIFADNEALFAKVDSVTSEYDVIFPSDYIVAAMIKENLLLKLNFKNIPNYQNIDDRFKNLPYDPKNEYSIPYQWGTNGIAVNTKKITEPIESWDIFWNEKYKGKISMMDDVRGVFYPALKKLGYSVNTIDPKELGEAKKLLLQQKALIKTYTASTPKDLLKSGEIWIAYAYSGDICQLKVEAPHIQYVIPKEGANIFVDTMCIPKSAPHKKNAEAFLNFLLRPDVSAKITNVVRYGTPNKASRSMINPDITNDPGVNPPQEVVSQCEFFKDLGDSLELYNNIWSEVKNQ
mgnify:FL=1